MYVVTSNEKNDLTQWQRRQDVQDVYAQVPGEPIALWQEIRKPEHHDDVTLKSPPGTRHLFPDLPIPINIPARYQVLDEHWEQAKPWTGATADGPGLGPVGDQPRYFAMALVQDTNNPAMPPFWVVNTHMTNGCEWDSTTPSSVATSLRPYWVNHWNLLAAAIQGLLDSGATVIWGGDTNRKDCPRLTPDQETPVGNDPPRIDKLAVIERSVQATPQTTGTVVTRSDHDARWVRWDLSKA